MDQLSVEGVEGGSAGIDAGAAPAGVKNRQNWAAFFVFGGEIWTKSRGKL